MIITRQWLRARGACYDDEQIDELVPPAGVTPQQVLEADLPAEDRVWALLHDDVIGREGVIEFARWCAERAQLHADFATDRGRAAAWADSAAKAVEGARSAAHAAHAAADAATYAVDAAADAATYAVDAAAARSAAHVAYAAAWAAEQQAQLDWIRSRLETQC